MIDAVVGERAVVVLGRGRLGVGPAGSVTRAAELGVPLVVLKGVSPSMPGCSAGRRSSDSRASVSDPGSVAPL